LLFSLSFQNSLGKHEVNNTYYYFYKFCIVLKIMLAPSCFSFTVKDFDLTVYHFTFLSIFFLCDKLFIFSLSNFSCSNSGKFQSHFHVRSLLCFCTLNSKKNFVIKFSCRAKIYIICKKVQCTVNFLYMYSLDKTNYLTQPS
jgi:hypothetical protein